MSRKLRVEEEKARQIKEVDEEIVEDVFVTRQRKIAAPLVWKRTSTGFSIVDAKEKYFHEIVEIFKEHYVRNEVLCKNTELYEDEESINCYMNRLLFQLKDNSSIMAIDENYVEEEEEGADGEKKKKKKKRPEDEKVQLAGALVMKVVRKQDFARVFSRIQLVQGEAMKKCVLFKSTINRKVDVFEHYGCDAFLRYYDLCILPQYRAKSLGYHMMSCGINVARALGVPVVMGLFQNYVLQKVAKKIGMEILNEMYYTQWRDSENELIFDDPGAGNYSCAAMAGLVPPVPPHEPPKIPEDEKEPAKPPKVTRKERRLAQLQKQIK